MKTLRKMVMVNSADYPYGEISLRSNVYLDGSNGAGKSTALRAVLYFYIADCGSAALNEKGPFKDFYFPTVGKSYLIYEVDNDERVFTVAAYRKNNDIKWLLADTPYSRDLFVSEDSTIIGCDEMKKKLSALGIDHSRELNPESFRKVIWGNSERELREYRKYNLVPFPRQEELVRIIQNSFMMNKIEGEDIKRILISGTGGSSINLGKIRDSLSVAKRNREAIRRWFDSPFGYDDILRGMLLTLSEIQQNEGKLGWALDKARSSYRSALSSLSDKEIVMRGARDIFAALQEELLSKEAERDSVLASLNTRKGAIGADIQNFFLHMQMQEKDRHERLREDLLGEKDDINYYYNRSSRNLDLVQKEASSAISKILARQEKFQEEGRELREKLHELEEELSELREKLDGFDGATIGWLEKNVKGWRNTIGKVVSEDILYMDSLSPSLVKGGTHDIYGVAIDLSPISTELESRDELRYRISALEGEEADLKTRYAQRAIRFRNECDAIKRAAYEKISPILDDFGLDSWTVDSLSEEMESRREELSEQYKGKLSSLGKKIKEEEERYRSSTLNLYEMEKRAMDGEDMEGIEGKRGNELRALEKEIEEQKDRFSEEIAEIRIRREKARDSLSVLSRKYEDLSRYISSLRGSVKYLEDLLVPSATLSDEKEDSLQRNWEEYRTLRESVEEGKKSVEAFVDKVRMDFSGSDIFLIDLDDSSPDPFPAYAQALEEISRRVGHDASSLIRKTIDTIYVDIINTVRNYADDFQRKKEEVADILRRINRELSTNTYVKAIKKLEIRLEDTTNTLVGKIGEIRDFCNKNNFQPEDVNIFMDEGRHAALSDEAKQLVGQLGDLLWSEWEQSRSLSLSEMFDIKIDITENGRMHRSCRSIDKIGSDGTEKMAKILLNISLLSTVMSGVERRSAPFALHCAIDETGQIDDRNIAGLISFANSKNIVILNAAPKITDTRPYEFIYRISRDSSNRAIVSESLRRIQKEEETVEEKEEFKF